MLANKIIAFWKIYVPSEFHVVLEKTGNMKCKIDISHCWFSIVAHIPSVEMNIHIQYTAEVMF